MKNKPTQNASSKLCEMYTNDFFNALLDKVITCISETLNFPGSQGATFVFAPRLFIGYPDNGGNSISWAMGIPAEYFDIKDTKEKFAAIGRWHHFTTGEGAYAVVICEPVPDADGKTKIVLHLSTFTQQTAIAVLYLDRNELGEIAVTAKQIITPITNKKTPLDMNPLMSFFHAITEDMIHETVGGDDIHGESKISGEQRSVRPVTKLLFDAIMQDVWPAEPVVADFGIDSQEHYEALYYPVKQGQITIEMLDCILGDGFAITKIVNTCSANPHKNILFKTGYDIMNEDINKEDFDEEELISQNTNEVLNAPLSEADILKAVDESEWVSGVVRVKLSELLECNGLEEFLDLMSMRLTGSGLLQKTEYEMVAVDNYHGIQHLQIKVTGDPALVAENIDTVVCKFCHKNVPGATAHLHEGEYVGDDCCWDERLRATE